MTNAELIAAVEHDVLTTNLERPLDPAIARLRCRQLVAAVQQAEAKLSAVGRIADYGEQ